MTVATPRSRPKVTPPPPMPRDRRGRSFRAMVPLTLVPASVATTPTKALSEWLYTGVCKDHGVGCATCDLCWEDTLQYHFLIENQRNRNRMWLGSDCITHFGILARDESGVVLGTRESARKVRRDKRKMRDDLRTRHVHEALDRLAAADPGFDAELYKREMGRLGGFRPDHARDLMARFERYGVEVAPSMIRVTLRHKRDREALAALSRADLRAIWRCLSASQRHGMPPA